MPDHLAVPVASGGRVLVCSDLHLSATVTAASRRCGGTSRRSRADRHDWNLDGRLAWGPDAARAVTDLQYTGNEWWQFNWKTPKTYTGVCRDMRLNLGDVSAHVARFTFQVTELCVASCALVPGGSFARTCVCSGRRWRTADPGARQPGR